MPAYLIHGFRWPRQLIRIHIILQNLEDAASDWLMAPQTVQVMANNLRSSFPEVMQKLPEIHFIEEYDPLASQRVPEPDRGAFAYVADIVHEIRLGARIDQLIDPSNPNPEAMTALHKSLTGSDDAPTLGWYVIHCGDTSRPIPQDVPSAPPELAHAPSEPNDNPSGTLRSKREKKTKHRDSLGSAKNSTLGKTSNPDESNAPAAAQASKGRSGLMDLFTKFRKPKPKSARSSNIPDISVTSDQHGHDTPPEVASAATGNDHPPDESTKQTEDGIVTNGSRQQDEPNENADPTAALGSLNLGTDLKQTAAPDDSKTANTAIQAQV